ncbi:MAG: MATE family efflux transporter, partial [Erysipelotrichaceae bacterium]
MVKDMTRGNPTKLLLSFSIPLLIGNIFQQLYGMVDTIIVGRGIGVNALAAVGSTGSINFLILGFVIGLAQGFAIMVSHAFGANDYKKMRKIYTMSIYLSLLIGILISVLSVLGAYDLLRIMNTPNNIINQATNYIQIIFGGMIITIFFNLFSSILRALGDSKTPLYAMIAATVV